MNRERHRLADRKRVLIALGVSVAVHAAALTTLKFDVPTFAQTDGSRPLQLVDLSDSWEDRATQVIALESAQRLPDGAAAETAASTSAEFPISEPGAAGVSTTVAALTDMVGDPGLAPGKPGLELALIEATTTSPVIVAVAKRRANRGIVRRDGGGGATGEQGFDFVASSEAARERERERGGNGWGGLGGIGVTVLGGGGVDCPTPYGAIGAYPGGGSGFGAINRIGPGR